jgi:hypothetical protein
MKSYKNLCPGICSFESLYLAYRAARRGKRERMAVACFELDLEHHLIELQRDLRRVTSSQSRYVSRLPQ